MTVIDCHHHFWTFGKRAHKFPPAVGTRLDHDYMPDHLRAQLKAAGVDKTILVQVLNEVDETHEFLQMSKDVDFVAGVVGWVPLTDRSQSLRQSARGYETARQTRRHPHADSI
jgi:L-fuconolactonase